MSLVKSWDARIEAVEVRGNCGAGFVKGEKFVLSGKTGCIDFKNSDRVCYWALSDLMPALLGIHLGVDPKELGMSNEKDVAYMCCSDPGPPYTPGGNVVFKITKL